MKQTLLLLMLFIGINASAQAPDLRQCDANNSGTGVFDLTVQTPILTNGLTNRIVNYFLTQADATNNTNPILAANAFMATMSPQMIFARIEKIADGTFQIYPFALILDPTPVVQDYPDVLVCNSYTLPQLPSGQGYYTAPNGVGMQLAPGMMITASTTIYVFASTPANCYAESSFVITVIPRPPVPNVPNVTVCDSYTLPALMPGQHYFTTPGGFGVELHAGDVITSSQTLYIFASSNEPPMVCVSETSFVITVNPQPPTPNVPDVTVCDQYILPQLPFGDYFSGPNGTGNMLSAGTAITATMTIYAQVGMPGCTSESSFVVTVLPSPNPQLQDGYLCNGGSYVLNSGLSNNFSFQWYRNNVLIANATQPTYTATRSGTYTVEAATMTSPSCLATAIAVLSDAVIAPISINLDGDTATIVGYPEGFATYTLNGGQAQSSNIFPNLAFGTYIVTILDPCGGAQTLTFAIQIPDAPLGQTTQTFAQGQTLAAIQIQGQNIQWYALPNGEAARADELPLPLSTLLVDGTTYYASQTVNGFESTNRLPVTVSLTLGLENMAFENLKFHPNPVKNTLEISNAATIDKVSIYNLLGQLVQEKATNSTLYQMNLSGINSGVYLVKIQSETNEKTVRIVKE